MVRGMKRLLQMAIAATVLLAAPVAHAEKSQPAIVMFLQGSPEADDFSVQLSADGRSYEIESARALEVGSGICWHPQGEVTRLSCEARQISGFEVEGGEADDTITFGAKVPVPTTLRGGPGNDVITAGAGADRILGGPGDDSLSGGSGPDAIYGGAGKDQLYGKFGNDLLKGGPGNDRLYGGAGNDTLIGGPGVDVLRGEGGTNTFQ